MHAVTELQGWNTDLDFFGMPHALLAKHVHGWLLPLTRIISWEVTTP